MGGYIGATAVGLTTTAADVQGDITSTDTTPEVILKNTTETDADGGREGTVTFKGEKSGGEEVTLAQIEGSHDDTNDDSRGQLVFKTNNNQLGDNVTEAKMTIDSVGDVDVTSGAPSITITNTTHEDTDGGRESKLKFKGEQSGGELSTLAQIEASHDGTADDEKGDLIFKTNDGSDGASPTEALRIESDQQVLITTSADAKGLTIKNSGNNRPYLNMDANRSGAGNNLAQMNFKWDGTDVARIIAVAGADTTNKDDAHITFGTASAGSVNEAMRIDSSGNVGIGTSSPSNSRLYLTGSGFAGQLLVAPTTSAYVGVGHGTDHPAIHWQTGDFRFATSTARDLTGFSEKMRITNGGQMFLNHTSSIGSGIATMVFGGTNKTIGIRMRAESSGNFAMGLENSSGTLVGSVVINASSTAYNTSSDYRLKENVTDVTDGITRVKQLAPKRFNFIADADTTVDGFLAHEAQTVVPEAITGTKDAMKDEEYIVTAAKGDVYTPATDDADEVVHSSNVEQPDTLEEGQQWREIAEAVMGTRSVPDMQGIDQAKLVPLLTAALQEAIAKIETLETKVAALEAG